MIPPEAHFCLSNRKLDNPRSSGTLYFLPVATHRRHIYSRRLSAHCSFLLTVQGILAKLRPSKPVTSAIQIDESIISENAVRDACVSHWRKFMSSSPLFKVDTQDYYRRLV